MLNSRTFVKFFSMRNGFGLLPYNAHKNKFLVTERESIPFTRNCILN